MKANHKRILDCLKAGGQLVMIIWPAGAKQCELLPTGHRVFTNTVEEMEKAGLIVESEYKRICEGMVDRRVFTIAEPKAPGGER